MSESGLAMLDSVTARVAAWRRRHRSRAGDIQRYQVLFDGAIVADLETRTQQALDDELGAAAWEIAQGLSRPATCDVIALSPEGVELARLPMRVMPMRAVDATAPSADMGAVVKVLLDANQQMMGLCKDMMTAVTQQLKEVSNITTELAKSTAKRARDAESEAATATATAIDAVQTIGTAAAPRRDVKEKIETFIEDMARAHFNVPRVSAENDDDKAANE
jgi:hypothetical protein